MADKTWKKVERAVAAYYGGQRMRVTGVEGEVPDVRAPHLSIEVKERAKGFYPKWLTSALQQAVDAAEPGEIPIVHLHTYQGNYDDDLVVMRACDFRILYYVWRASAKDEEAILEMLMSLNKDTITRILDKLMGGEYGKEETEK